MPRLLKPLSLVIATVALLMAQTTTKVDFGTQIKNGPLFSDVTPVTNTLANFCTAAGLGTLAITRAWNAMNTQTVACKTLQFNGGIFQPAAGKVVTIAGSVIAGRNKIFDTSLGGPGSITFAPPSSTVSASWFGSTLSTTSGATDTLRAPLLAAMESLPVAGPSTGGTVYTGHVTIDGPTGGGTSRYNLGSTFTMSPRVWISGEGPQATTVGIPTGGFTGNYVFMVFDANGSGDPNDNFYTVLSDLQVDAFTNAGAGTPGCFDWGVSIGSKLENLTCLTKGIGALLGGSGVGTSIDSTSGSNLTFNLMPVSTNVLTAQAMVWPSASFSTNTQVYSQIAVKGSGSPQTYPCSGNPAFDLGQFNFNFDLNGLNLENIPCGFVIQALYAHIYNVVAGPDCYGACNLNNNPWVFLIDPASTNVYVSGIFDAYKFGILLGHPWRPGNAGWPLNYEIIDLNAHIQKVTTAGAGGSVQPPWSTSGGTTADGLAIWSDQGVVSAVCNASLGVTINCAMPTIAADGSLTGPTGSNSGTDTTFYSFVYDSNAFFATGINPGNQILTKNGHEIIKGANSTMTGSGCTGTLIHDTAGIFTATGGDTCALVFGTLMVNPSPVCTGKGDSGAVTCGVSAISTSGTSFTVSAAGKYYYHIDDVQ